MQQLTGAPRSALTTAQVMSLLTGPAVTWDAGAELLNPNLTVAGDVSALLSAATVKRTMSADIHGTASFTIDTELAWGTSLVRLYTVAADRPTAPTVSARFNAGVYCLTTPTRAVGTSAVQWQVTGYDRLYLLKRQVGDSYYVPAGTGYLAAVTAAISAAGLSTSTVLLDSTAASKTLPSVMAWPLVRTATAAPTPTMTTPGGLTIAAPSGPATWLTIINDLLSAVGYRGLWCDQDGIFRSEPYQLPTARAVDWTFTVGNLAGEVHAAEDATLVRDDWATPNRWVFVQRNALYAPAEGSGQYTVNDAAGQQRRGLVWPSVVDLDAADQASLVVQGDARVAADKRVAATITRSTRPFPLVGHADVYSLADPALGATMRVQSATWEQDLFGGDTKHEWQVVG